MKYLKKFEFFRDEPRVGDYVKIEADYFDDALIEFFKTNIGRIINIENSEEYNYIVEFDDIVPLSTIKTIGIELDEIIEWASDKDGLKIKKEINKYNL